VAKMSENEQSAKALEESVSVWEKKLAQVERWEWYDVNFSAATCPLCRAYIWGRQPCKRCPVSRDTGGYPMCIGSPYKAVRVALARCQDSDTFEHALALEAAVKAELDYLRYLLEKERSKKHVA